MATLRERLAGEVPCPLVAVSFGDDDPEGDAARARDLGVDVAELRIDWYRSTAPEHVLRTVAAFAAGDGPATLATIRSKAEGGHWPGGEPERLALFQAVLAHVDAVDVELSSGEILPGVLHAARGAGKPVVVSHHDFAATPDERALSGIVEAALAAGADLVKVSTMAHGPDDLRVLAGLLVRHQSMIVVGMGEHGAGTRVFFPLLGSRITYAAIGGRHQPAPGQLPFAETVRLLETFSPAFAERRRAGGRAHD
jgi:3-dehydroquinate dehydratase-1